MWNWFTGGTAAPNGTTGTSPTTTGGPGDAPGSDPEVPSPIHANREDVEPQPDGDTQTRIDPTEADEVLPEMHKSLLSQLISSGQLKIGMDLTKIVLPTFLLEPRTLLEKLSDFWVHPDLFMDIASKAPLPEQPTMPPAIARMLRLVRWYVSGFHVRPKGVKKPYNPVLGETFECELADGALWYIAEQVSHHPPVSAFYVQCPGALQMHGMYYPRSKFLGNSAASIGEGCSVIVIEGSDEVYRCTWPSAYVRGIVFGTLLMEVGGKVEIICDKTNVHAHIDFKTKGFWSGSYNSVAGGIFYADKGYHKPEVVLRGKWTEAVEYQYRGGPWTMLFDTKRSQTSPVRLSTRVVPEERSSRTQWQGLTQAIRANDMDAATREKNRVESTQRELRAQREKNGEKFTPQYFAPANTDVTASNQQWTVLRWVYVGPNAVHHKYIDSMLEEEHKLPSTPPHPATPPPVAPGSCANDHPLPASATDAPPGTEPAPTTEGS